MSVAQICPFVARDANRLGGSGPQALTQSNSPPLQRSASTEVGSAPRRNPQKSAGMVYGETFRDWAVGKLPAGLFPFPLQTPFPLLHLPLSCSPPGDVGGTDCTNGTPLPSYFQVDLADEQKLTRHGRPGGERQRGIYFPAVPDQTPGLSTDGPLPKINRSSPGPCSIMVGLTGLATTSLACCSG